MSNKVKYTTLIVLAAVIGGATEAAGLFPGAKEILVALNLFLGAVMVFVGNQKPPAA